jgi:exopolysaccharide biosynthesis polyprenyl glycosylphosphotransferase
MTPTNVSQHTNVTQQTSTALPLHGEFSRAAPGPQSLQRRSLVGPLQWALEGSGWSVVRPVLDFVLLCIAVTVALHGVDRTLHVQATAAPLLALPLLVMLLLYLRGLYRRRMRSPVLEEIVPVISGVSVAAMAVAATGLVLNGEMATYLWVRAWLAGLVAVAAGRALLSLAQHWARAQRLVAKPVLIVGAGVVGAQVARRLETHPEYGLVPVGFLDEDPPSITEVGGRDVPVLGTVDDLDQTIARTGVKNLIVAFTSVADARVSRVIQRCMELGIDVSVVPRMFDAINNRVGYESVGGLPLLSFTTVDPRGAQFAVKHALDRALGLMLLVVLSPLFLLAALAVRLSSPGPVLFAQRRVGRDGKAFELYKFRSMRLGPPGSEPDGQENSPLEFLLGGDTAPGGVEGDDRRTAVGRLLRRTSVDELPQLLNVLRGEMSLVGPRPERPEFVELFRQDIIRYGDRHRVKSGITGWAQVHGLRGQTSLAERVEWDNYYIAHWSVGLDLRILAMTVVALFRKAE